MNNELATAQSRVFDIQELKDHIVYFISKDDLLETPMVLTVSKKFHRILYTKFKLYFPTKEIFSRSLAQYCNNESEKNPQWILHIYQRYYFQLDELEYPHINQKNLNNYQFKASVDAPWKQIFLATIVTTAINTVFKVMNQTPFLSPAIIMAGYFITVTYFLCAHLLTLSILFKFNYYIKTEKLFQMMTIALITQTLMINIARSI